MKKFVRLLSVILLVLLMALSFCSCKELDEMRELRAFYGETQDVLIFRGKEYKLLPMCEYLYIEADNDGSICEDEVPILLSGMFGDYMYFDNNSNFVVSGTWPNSDGVNMVYCRTDLYDNFCEKIENLEMDYYCYYNPKYIPNNAGLTYRAYSLLPEKGEQIIMNSLVGEGIATEWRYDKYNLLTEFQCCDETIRLIDHNNAIYFVERDGEFSFIVYQQNGEYLKFAVSTEDALTILQIIDPE